MARCPLRNTTRTIETGIAKTCTKKASLQRALSTSKATANLKGNSNVIPPLTLLHKTSKILPRVLEYGLLSFRGQRVLKSEIWEKILANVYEDLSPTAQRPVRLAVHSVDEWSGSEDFVTALLSNPLDSDEGQSQMLGDRWKNASNDTLTISYGPKVRVEGSTIKLSTPYLQRFSAPIEVIELRGAPSTQNHQFNVLENQVLGKLFEADIPILLCNPLATSVESLLSTPLPSNTIIVVTSNPSQPMDLDQLLSHVPRHSPKPTLLIADPKRASDAITLLQSSPTSSLVVQRFQDAYNDSNLATVTQALENILHPASQPPSKQIAIFDTLRAKLALARLHDALSQCLASLAEMKDLLDRAYIDASHLNDRLIEIRAKVEIDFLGPSSEASLSATKPRHNEVAEAIHLAESQMKTVLSRFTWWRMIWRVDEVTTLLAAALQRTWCPELEKKLLVHTGQLYSIQTEMTKASFSLLSRHQILQTNVIRNSLMQLEASPQYRLTTDTLTAPISSRREQMIEHPTTRLHVTAQRVVLGMTGGIVGGSGICWLGWMSWLVGSGDGLLGSLGLEPGTAMGLGALSAVASVRWAVGQWEKGKKKWWDDWRRVGDGLDRDLRTTLDRSMQQQVGGVVLATSKGLAQLIAQRENDLGKLTEEAQRLTEEVNAVVRVQTPITN